MKLNVISKGVIGDQEIQAWVPTNAICPNGDIIVSCNSNCDIQAGEFIYFWKSEDNGKTWNRIFRKIYSIFENGGVEATTLTCLEDGTLILPYADAYYINKHSVDRHVNVFTMVSEDNGNTWQREGPFKSNSLETFPYGKVIETEDYLLMSVFGSHEKHGPLNWRIKLMASLKEGNVNWKNYYPVAPKNGDETSIVSLGGKKLVSVIRGYKDDLLNTKKNHRKHPFYITFSDTGGKFWTKPKKMGIRGTTPALHITSKGNLLLGYRKVIDAETVVCNISISKDSGKTWEDGVQLELPEDCRWYHGGYPTFSNMKDGKIFVTFHNGYPEWSAFYNILEEEF